MTATFDLALEGVRPEPLGSYLKALAVLRLVSEQKDPRAAGYWRDDVFHLVSVLDRGGLLRFFAEEYAPTPIVGPWGARSGFFPGSSETSARQALNTILASDAVRLRPFRDVILAVRRLLDQKGLSQKAKDDDKIELLADLRNELPDSALPWLDAAYVLGTRDERGQLSRAYPPILGTGGNEGSQGYASTFMQALVELGITSGSAVEPKNALFGLPEDRLAEMASGQYMPGLAGGFNQGPGFSGGPAPMSAWEIVLLFEGAATWVSGPSVRQGTRALGRESSPFTVRQMSLGGSTAPTEEAKARAEIWAPLWERPARWAEVAALFAEGRMHVGRHPARDTLQMARAAASLGVDRGITDFVRYPILVRNGKSYFAFAIGRFRPSQRPEAELVGSLEIALRPLDAALRREKNTPARIIAARRAVSEAMFEVLRAGDPLRVTELLRTIGRLDAAVARWPGGRSIDPLKGLSPAWLERAAPSPELRIAAALASIRGQSGVGPFRSNLVGVDAASPHKWATGTGQSAWRGARLPHRLASVLTRRMMDGAREKSTGNPLAGRAPVSLPDIAEFIDERTSDTLIEELLHALSWIDWSPRAADDTRALDEALRTIAHARSPRNLDPPRDPPRVYALLKLCFWPTKIAGVQVVPEPSLVPLLVARRVPDACRLAQRRLRAHGINVLDLASSLARVNLPFDPARLAGSLLIPVAGLESLIDAVTVRTPKAKKTTQESAL